MSKRSLAIIPARGGSKRLPRKNILEVGGKPLIAWTIEAAQNSSVFDSIFVSTDDCEIADISSFYGAEILFRPKELSSDRATCAEVCYFHLQETNLSALHERLYCLYPTAPMRNQNDIQNIDKIFQDNKDALAVLATSEYFFYPYQALSINPSNEVKPFWSDLSRLRSTDLPPLVAGNGSTYAIEISSFLEKKDFYLSSNMYAYRMPKSRSIDVDTIEDYQILKALFAQTD